MIEYSNHCAIYGPKLDELVNSMAEEGWRVQLITIVDNPIVLVLFQRPKKVPRFEDKPRRPTEPRTFAGGNYTPKVYVPEGDPPPKK